MVNKLDEINELVTWVARELCDTQHKEMYDKSIKCCIHIEHLKHKFEEIQKETQSTRKAYAKARLLDDYVG